MIFKRAGKRTGKEKEKQRVFPKDEWESADIIRGGKDMPWVIFIHGLGVDKRMWSAPDEACILGGLFPLGSIVRMRVKPGARTDLKAGAIGADENGGHETKRLQSLYHDLASAGFTTLAFSFRRPAGAIEEAALALKGLLDRVKAEKPCGMVLVGHSRGGLIASKYLERANLPIKGFISIASPHLGTTLARWAVIARPATALIKTIQPKGIETRIGTAISRIIAFIESPAVAELLPGSGFYTGLNPPSVKCPSISAGGTDPRLFSFLGMGFPELFEKIMPGWALPDEIKSGLGDGLVSAKSSVYPYGQEHLNFPVNHAEAVFDTEVRAALVKRIMSFLG